MDKETLIRIDKAKPGCIYKLFNGLDKEDISSPIMAFRFANKIIFVSINMNCALFGQVLWDHLVFLDPEGNTSIHKDSFKKVLTYTGNEDKYKLQFIADIPGYPGQKW